MIANRWYSIAQTTVFDTSCGINITFGESSSVLFTASVKYGVSSLNISSCFIEDDYNISIRLRETESKWCVDLLSNTDIEPAITITDSPYWVADNSAAGSGAIIAVIENISKDFNTTGGGGQGGGESLFEMVNVGTDAVPVYAVVPKNFNGNTVHIFSRGGVSAGGFSGTDNEGNPTGSLGGLSNVDPTADSNFYSDKVLVKRANSATWGVVDLSSIVGLDEEALKRYLTNNLYVTQTDLEPYDERLKTLEALGFKLQKHEVDGVTKYYVESAYDFYSKGGISSGGIGGQGGGGGTGGGSTVSYIPTVTSGEPLGTLIIDGTPTEIYSPSLADYAKSKDVANTYATKTALNDYATITALGTATDNITTLQGYFNSGIAKEAAKVSNALTFEEGAFSVDSYNGSTTKTIKVPTTTSHISEGDNLYYTNARVLKAVADSLGLSTKTENGKTYLRSAYDFFSEGGVSSGGIGTSGGGSGSNVSYSSALSGGTLLGTIHINGVPNAIYAPSALPNPYALTINGTTYDGSAPVNVTISGGTADSIAWDAITGKPSLVYYDTRIDTNTLANSVNKIGYGYATEGWYESGPALSFGVENYQFQMQMRLSAEISSVVWRPVQSGTKFTWRHFLDAYNYSNYALPLSGGTITGSNETPLYIASTDKTQCRIVFKLSDSQKALIGYSTTYGAWMYNYTANTFLGIKDDATLYYYSSGVYNTLIHSGNIGSHKAGDSAKLDGIDADRYMLGHNPYAVDADYIFDLSYHSVAGGSHLPSSSQYGSLLTMPYRKTAGNSTPDFGTQIFIPNGDDAKPYMWFRTSLGSKWNSWRKVVSEEANGNVLIGTTTDGGGKLQVNGDVRAIGYYLSEVDPSFTPKNKFGLYMWDNVVQFTKRDLSNAYLKELFSIDLSTEVTKVTGNFYATGGVSSGSDSRYKTRIKDVSVDIETIAKAPLFVYKWADREDDNLHLGTTAQYWYDTDFRNAVVPTTDEKLWTMSYGEITMGNTIILAREQLKVKSRVEVLEDRVKELETELNKYRRA